MAKKQEKQANKKPETLNQEVQENETPLEMRDILTWLSLIRGELSFLYRSTDVGLNSIEEGHGFQSSVRGVLPFVIELANDSIQAIQKAYPKDDELKEVDYDESLQERLERG